MSRNRFHKSEIRPVRTRGGGAHRKLPRALVYRGPASSPGCPESVAHLLASGPTKFEVCFVGPHERLQLNEETLSGASLYAQPGGGELDEAFVHVQHHVPAVQEFVRRGGRYLGFCLGGYLAGHTPGFGLCPGDADQYAFSADSEVQSAECCVLELDWQGRSESMYFQDGPYFWLDDRGRGEGNVVVLARYRNGRIAAMTFAYGSGRVGVVGPHPEADASWFVDDGLPRPQHDTFGLGHALIEEVMF